MIDGLEGFLRELRREGLVVSPAEWLDALRAVGSIGLERRGRFKTALGCTLAKGKHRRDVFERVFEGYFVAPGTAPAGAARRSGVSGVRAGGATAGDERNPRARGRSPRASPPLARLLEGVRDAGPLPRTRLRRVLLRPVTDPVPQGSSHRAPAAERAAAPRRDVARALTFDEERGLAVAAQRLVEGIRLRSGRRLRRRSSGRLHLRQLFRRNVRHGGVPFVLPRRRRRRTPAKVVLLIDVSWSAASAAGLFLTLAAEFLRRAGRTRVLLFVDRVTDASAAVHRFWQGAPGRADRAPRAALPGAAIVRGSTSFADVLHADPALNLGAPSDYGRALHALVGSPLAPRGRNTVLVVLGDGRSNRFDPLAWAFEELAARCGAVLWLVPEGVERWGTGDSALGAYLPHVDVAVEARDLQGLADGVACLVRRL